MHKKNERLFDFSQHKTSQAISILLDCDKCRKHAGSKTWDCMPKGKFLVKLKEDAVIGVLPEV